MSHMEGLENSNQTTKRPRGAMSPTKPATLDSLQDFLQKLDSKFDDKHKVIEEHLTCLEQSLATQLSALTEDMNGKITKAKEECINRNDANTKKIVELDALVKKLENHISETRERNNRSNDIIMRGIPTIDDENDGHLLEIFLLICKNINCDTSTSSIAKIFRLKSRESHVNMQSNRLVRFPNILVKFIDANCKNKFMSSYFKIGKLSLTHAGFESSTRIYCSDNLTANDYKLFLKVLKLKGSKICSAYTNNGVIFCRTAPNAKPIEVLCEEDLDNLPVIYTNDDPTSVNHSSSNVVQAGPPHNLRSKGYKTNVGTSLSNKQKKNDQVAVDT